MFLNPQSPRPAPPSPSRCLRSTSSPRSPTTSPTTSPSRPHTGPTLALYIGSSIGNFAHHEAVSILRNLRAQLRPGDTLLLGTDLVKDIGTLEAAYCDADGVTEAFNLNMLRRLNRELGAGFDLGTFRHVACFNREASRIEMHLKSTRTQQVRIPALDLSIPFQAGETIHTEKQLQIHSGKHPRLTA